MAFGDIIQNVGILEHVLVELFGQFKDLVGYLLRRQLVHLRAHILGARQAMQPGHAIKIGVKAGDLWNLPLPTGQCNESIIGYPASSG